MVTIMTMHIQEWTNENLWKTTFKKIGVIWSVLTEHITSSFLKVVFRKFYLVFDPHVVTAAKVFEVIIFFAEESHHI